MNRIAMLISTVLIAAFAACDNMIDDSSAASRSFFNMMLLGNTVAPGDHGHVTNPDLVNGEPYWSKTYGTAFDEIATSACRTGDGGYLIAGYGDLDREGIRSKDGRIIRIDESGTLIWERYYGGTGEDKLLAIIPADNRNFIATGFTAERGGAKQGWVVKLNPQGEQIWDSSFGGEGDGIVNSIIKSSSGGYVCAGASAATGKGMDAYIVRLDDSGAVEWQRRSGGACDDVGNAIVEAEAGYYVIAGYTRPLGAKDMDSWVFKIRDDGEQVTVGENGEEWNYTYRKDDNDSISSIIKDKDGGYVLAGFSTSLSNGFRDSRILKIDAAGALVWDKTYESNGDEEIHSLCAAQDGGYMSAGRYANDIDYSDIWLQKVDANGNLNWRKTYGGPADDSAFSIIPGYKGSFLVTGYMTNYMLGSEDFWAINIDNKGDIPVK
jgi:hypothetical protein